jgi:hypothetical protein
MNIFITLPNQHLVANIVDRFVECVTVRWCNYVFYYPGHQAFALKKNGMVTRYRWFHIIKSVIVLFAVDVIRVN